MLDNNDNKKNVNVINHFNFEFYAQIRSIRNHLKICTEVDKINRTKINSAIKVFENETKAKNDKKAPIISVLGKRKKFKTDDDGIIIIIYYRFIFTHSRR